MKINNDPSKSNFQFKIPNPGLYNARIARIIDLGTQTKPAGANYPAKQVKQMRMVFELVDTNEVFKEGTAPQPFFIKSKDYTQSLLGKNNNLRNDLLSLNGRLPEQNENLTVLLQSMLGMPCLVQIIHKPSTDVNQNYANIHSIMPAQNPATVAPLRNPTIFFDMEQPSCVGEYQKINGSKLLEKIHSSPEFQALVRGGRIVQRVIEQKQQSPSTQQPQQQYVPPAQNPQAQQQWTPPPQPWQQQQPVQNQQPPMANPNWPAQQPVAQPNNTPPAWPVQQPSAQQQQPTAAWGQQQVPVSAVQPVYNGALPQQPAQAWGQPATPPTTGGVPQGYVLNPNFNPNVVGSQQFIPAVDDLPF